MLFNRTRADTLLAREGVDAVVATSRENVASQKVLIKAGFVPAGPAGPADLGGKQGTWYQRDLTVFQS